MQILVIVESPGKIKKLESILGKGYVVMSSYGHIMDLHPSKISIDFDNNFEPEYHVITGEKKFQDKKKVVKDLKEMAKKASKVIIASDNDREGEMIGWSYKEILKLNDNQYERITFNSITKEEVKKAINNPTKLDLLMVNSQKTRRILDRIVGFKISPCINKIMGMTNLSAGRVQSIVVRLICEKEKEIKTFFESDNASFFKVNGILTTNNIQLKCELYTDLINNNKVDTDDDIEDKDIEDDNIGLIKAKILSYDNAKKIMKNISLSIFNIINVLMKKSKRYSSAPYTTSTAQQDASTKLGFGVKRTMNSLQKLYEAGYTTYLRTDSTNLSNDALKQCSEYIKEKYGAEYHNLKNYTNSKGNTQDAHEAIRPVDMNILEINIDKKIGPDEQKIYDMVWKRTVASQMSCANVDVYNIIMSISKEKNYFFKTSIENIIFQGHLIIYNENNKSNHNIIIPKKGQKCEAKEINCSEEYKRPPLRYSEAGLIKKMDPKNLNIGRPATYAEIINTIQKRNYVEIKDIDGEEKKSINLKWNPKKSNEIIMDENKIHIGREKKKFYPTQLGINVNSILIEKFPDIMEYEFTANMELELDEIAGGTKIWNECLNDFWNKLRPLLENIETEKKKRIIGKHPETKKEIIATNGKYGPILTIERTNKKNDLSIAPIKEPLTIETITLEQAIEILKYPKIIGKFEKKNVELKIGKYGYYIVHGKKSASLPVDTDPDEINLEKALKYLEIKEKKNQEKYLYYYKKDNIEYIVNNGKYGENNKYLMIKNLSNKKEKPAFLPFPANENIEKLTFERIKEISKNNKKSNKNIHRL